MIEVALYCDVDDCEESLRLEWPRGGYVSLLDPAKFGKGGGGYLTLDGAAAVPMSATGWRVQSERRPERRFGYTVRCPAHGDVS